MFRLKFPFSLRIENTNFCNAQCIMCPRDEHTRKKGIMSLDQFKLLADECSDKLITEIHLHGYGEPLLDKNLSAKIAYAKYVNIPRTHIISNATLITEKLAYDLVSSGLDSIKISLNGNNQHDYERIQKGLKYENCLSGIRNLVAAKISLKQKNPTISVQFMNELADSHPDENLIEYLKLHTVITSSKLHNWGNTKSTIKNISPSGYKSCDKIQSKIMQILWNGDVVPCCLDFNGTEILGNVFETSITSVWNSSKFLNFIEKHNNQTFPEICKNCSQLSVYTVATRIKNLIKGTTLLSEMYFR